MVTLGECGGREDVQESLRSFACMFVVYMKYVLLLFAPMSPSIHPGYLGGLQALLASLPILVRNPCFPVLPPSPFARAAGSFPPVSGHVSCSYLAGLVFAACLRRSVFLD